MQHGSRYQYCCCDTVYLWESVHAYLGRTPLVIAVMHYSTSYQVGTRHTYFNLPTLRRGRIQTSVHNSDLFAGRRIADRSSRILEYQGLGWGFFCVRYRSSWILGLHGDSAFEGIGSSWKCSGILFGQGAGSTQERCRCIWVFWWLEVSGCVIYRLATSLVTHTANARSSSASELPQ